MISIVQKFRISLRYRLYYCKCDKFFGSGALSGKMLPVTIVENNEIDDYFKAS